MKHIDLPRNIKFYGCYETVKQLELAEGKELFDVIMEDVLNNDRRRAIAYEIALGIKELHGVGVVHKDIKPDNIIVNILPGNKANVRIIDYGLSCFVPMMSENCRGSGEHLRIVIRNREMVT